jgi:hypothetical protein
MAECGARGVAARILSWGEGARCDVLLLQRRRIGLRGGGCRRIRSGYRRLTPECGGRRTGRGRRLLLERGRWRRRRLMPERCSRRAGRGWRLLLERGRRCRRWLGWLMPERCSRRCGWRRDWRGLADYCRGRWRRMTDDGRWRRRNTRSRWGRRRASGWRGRCWTGGRRRRSGLGRGGLRWRRLCGRVKSCRRHHPKAKNACCDAKVQVSHVRPSQIVRHTQRANDHFGSRASCIFQFECVRFELQAFIGRSSDHIVSTR